MSVYHIDTATQNLRLGITSVSSTFQLSILAIYPQTFFQNWVLATKLCIYVKLFKIIIPVNRYSQPGVMLHYVLLIRSFWKCEKFLRWYPLKFALYFRASSNFLFYQRRTLMWVLISRILVMFTYDGKINDGIFLSSLNFFNLVVRNRPALGPGHRFEKRISYGKGVM